VSDARTRALERASVLDPAARPAFLAEWLRADPACEECGPDHGHKGRPPGKVLTDIQPFNGGTRPAFTARLVDCPDCFGTGTQRRWRVELAAYAGCEAAVSALGPTPWRGVVEEGSLKPPFRAFPDWVRGLSRWGREACVQAALAACRHMAYEQARCHATVMLDRVTASWDAVQAWVDCPCRDHERAAREASALLHGPLWVEAPATALVGGDFVPGVEECARLLSAPAAVREAIQRALVAWCLP
jgi:hypothetical protein